MRQVVLMPVLQTYGFENESEMVSIFLLMGATVFIAAGGYVLNDYFDVKIDAINKPDKQIVSNTVSRNAAMRLYQILTAIGIICGLILAFWGRSFTLGFIFVVVPGLLWFYSASYKRQFITGNLIVSFLAALTILVVGITQLAFMQKEFGKLIFETPIPAQFYSWIGGFAIFSFLTTWIREIIKDVEDEKGDREMECRTMPIKWGVAKTKIFLYCLISFTVIGLFLVNEFFIQFPGTLTTRYILFGIALPYAALIYLIAKSKTAANYHQASTLSKVIMLIGVLYCFIFYYLQAKTFGISLFNLFIVK
ncbi:MAG: geranylgeranylglycerol-phosphate geranylgeranyltransferase [Paludibacter sp.]|nr:geranylgeranylglycerol-phosphate geranylgeranyltransferase [Paludibacter sp.]